MTKTCFVTDDGENGFSLLLMKPFLCFFPILRLHREGNHKLVLHAPSLAAVLAFFGIRKVNKEFLHDNKNPPSGGLWTKCVDALIAAIAKNAQ